LAALLMTVRFSEGGAWWQAIVLSGMSVLPRTGLDLLDQRVLAHAPDGVLLEFAVDDATRVYKPNDRDFAI
jgi:hypothetical protein